MARDETNPPGSLNNSSEFVQLLREFTARIRDIRATDLSTSDRAKLRALLETLTRLAAQPSDPKR
jgi:hypothetical protein